jgi:HPt (histidine-containing phosphotransfer) domain-containing protein
MLYDGAGIDTRRFDLILMDVQMPDIDGLRATSEIRGREKAGGGHIPIVALTASAVQDDRECCLAAGMDGYLTKPLRMPALLQAIEQAAPAEPPAPPVLDERALFARLNGDRNLLGELIGVFLADSVQMQQAVAAAIEAGDAAALCLAAHKLKGAVANFSAPSTQEAALRLETLGRQQDLSQAPAAYATLEKEVTRLRQALEDLRRRQG